MALLSNLAGHLRASIVAPAQGAATVATVAPIRAVIQPTASPVAPVVDAFTGSIRAGRRVLPTGFVRRVLETQDNQPNRLRVGLPNYVHASSLVDFCPRQTAIARLEERPLFESVTGGHRVMWEVGRGVEKHIRSQYIRAVNRRGVLGRWRCPCEALTRSGYYSDEAVCDTCQKPAKTYNELTLFDEDNKISGNPDILIDHDGAVVPVEIKSMVAKSWEELTEPKPDHVLQVSMYGHLLRANNRPTLDTGVIIYCTKDFKFGSPYKEYHVDFTAAAVRMAVARAVADAQAVVSAAAQGILPPRILCPTPTCGKAKRCPVVAGCFNRE